MPPQLRFQLVFYAEVHMSSDVYSSNNHVGIPAWASTYPTSNVSLILEPAYGYGYGYGRQVVNWTCVE